MDQLCAETSRKSSEVDRLRQALDRDRQEVERLAIEKQSLEDRLNAMSREKDMMEDSTKNLDNKINQMRRSAQTLISTSLVYLHNSCLKYIGFPFINNLVFFVEISWKSFDFLEFS